MSRRYWADLGERVGETYLLAFVGLLMAHGTHLLSVSSLRSAALAAIPATLMTVKGLIGRRIGDPQSAGFLPAPKGGGSGAGQ